MSEMTKPVSVHEEFDTQTSQSQRKWLIRQDRIQVAPETAFLEVRGRDFEVVNYSPFGLATRGPIELLGETEFQNISFRYHSREVGRYHLRLVRQRPSGDGDFIAAFEILGEPLDILTLVAIDRSVELLALHEAEVKLAEKIPARFRQIVLEIKDRLEHLKVSCDQIEQNLDWESPDVNTVRDLISQIVGSSLSERIASVYRDLQQELLKLKEEDSVGAITYFRTKLRHVIYKSPLANRAYMKPLGYAGDFQMMNMMYDHHRAGTDLFSKCIHQHFIQDPASKAVQNRAEYLKTKITQHLKKSSGTALRFLSVASGPAKEVQLLLSDPALPTLGPVEFHFIDQDEKALQDAQKKVNWIARKRKHACTFHFHHLAIKNIIARGLPEKGFSLIYSAGLFDYFSDPVATLAATRLGEGLSPGGQLIIGNFNVTNPSRAIMELALDWELIYRSKEDLNRLYSSVGKSVEIQEEQEGINLFCIISK